ncbi:MAG: efflux RND transporter periplasmic adaptor subunit [Methylophaga sp.]
MKKSLNKLVLLMIAIAVLLSVILYTSQMMAAQSRRPMPQQAETVPAPEVSVIPVKTDSYAAEIEAFGAAEAHYAMTLTAQVAGQVEQVSERFEAGQRLSAGDWMARLENSDYQAAVESARQTLAQAEVDLLEEERMGLQALAEWQASGLEGEPDSDLVLRKPQLNAAQRAVAQAKASLKSAEKDLAQTTIKAPFDALVTDRMIAPGSFVQVGTEVASLYSTDRVEIAVALSARDWQNLPSISTLDSGKWPVSLTSVEDNRQWSGHVLRAEQHLDGDTRQRALIVAVDAPFDQSPVLFPGTFVRANIEGRLIEGLWKLPSSALSQRGEIWYIDDKQTLQKFTATALFSKEGYIFVKPPADFLNQTVSVLTHPLNSYLQGMAVTPLENASHD